MTTATATRPHAALYYIRPDEVAECWSGCTNALYEHLWSVMDHVPAIPNVEDSGPADHVGHGSVASMWEHFDDQDRLTLNALAARQGGF